MTTVKERKFPVRKRKVEYTPEDVLKMRITLEVLSTNKKLPKRERDLLEYTKIFFLFRKHPDKENNPYQEELERVEKKLDIGEKRILALNSLVIDAEEHSGDSLYKENLGGLYERIDEKLSSL